MNRLIYVRTKASTFILDHFLKDKIDQSWDSFSGHGENMKKELCIDTFKAVVQRYKLSGTILHSDRGSQYTSAAFREELERAGVTQSLSSVNHCYDNSRIDSFFATLKKELLYRIPAYRMKRDTVKSIICSCSLGTERI